MEIVVTGANGLLGQHLVQHLLKLGHRVKALAKGPPRISYDSASAFSYHRLDIRDEAEMERFFLSSPPVDVLIHAAALTQVDYCEQNRQEAYDVNVAATGRIVHWAKSFCNYFLYVSTDFVFDGLQGNYREDDKCSPVNYYGETKLLAEDLVRAAHHPWAIARTCLVYGNAISGTRSNIISWVKENLENGRSIKVVSDQVRTPTYIKDLVNGIWLLAAKKAEGVYHISGSDILTPYDMACMTADYFDLDKSLLEKVDASVFTQPALRPLRTGFDITKARTQLGFTPMHFADAIKAMYDGSHP